jgi:Protein of unknown function (DUF4019)
MKLRILALLALLWTFPALAGPAEDEAAAAAKTWLAVVDAKNYPESWKDAADLFQQGVSEAKWDGMVQGARDKVGPLKSRDLQAVQLTKTLPGVPDGDYAVVSFKADFETKGPSTEVITLVHEHGKWKVGGYFIQ